jgi:ATP-dependent DNA helicase RecQ
VLQARFGDLRAKEIEMKGKGREWTKLERKAREVFGVQKFRPGQRELLEAVLQSRDAVGILPTGGGKSLCFQLASLFLPRPVVVVTPLISLAEDQTDKLERFRVPAARVDSTLKAAEARAALGALDENALDLIYVTPERLQNADFLQRLTSVGCSLLVIDEAHCISEWGHDFRPAFMRLRQAAEALGRPPILALTATATPAVERDIIESLALQDPLVMRTSSERPNLHLSVRHCETEDDQNLALKELVRDEPGTALVYTATVKAAKAVWTMLVNDDLPAGLYHGDLNAQIRDVTQDAFMDGRYRIVVATKAFGMGIDKPNTRLVVHYQVPGSLESYYQEVGRAGRDGKPARGVLLYRRADVRVQRFFLATKHPKAAALAKFVASLFDGGDAAELPERLQQVVVADLERLGFASEEQEPTLAHCVAKRDEVIAALTELYERRHADDSERLQKMLRYAELRACRTAELRRYFGEEGGPSCAHCDYCLEDSVGIREVCEASG